MYRCLGFAVLSAAALVAQGLLVAADRKSPLPPAEAARCLATPGDLGLDLILAEPIVRQPVHLSFDERGRLWVVQYLQYPHPAGLKMLSRDGVWRAVYDKVPLPPPDHVPGADKITIHEDTDGDGVYDRHKVFIDGLNIATAVARGRGGVWVLNPPYLLFYADRNSDDVPDAAPEVHLSGFGLEDTHSVVNSLTWGPDGWLYAAQGSTVTANVRRPGSEAPPIHSMGQLIWRYHPETRRYEIFAEGGGNAFGVEIDALGRTYSGHNGGDTRGFHYVQGGYFQKGFAKHGPLSNPYSFGYFPAMTHSQVQRFTHTFAIYDGDRLPEAYRGKLFGVAPLLHHVVISELAPDGSTFRTRDVGFAVTSSDPWFTPVDIKHGPDGALYVADWYDGQCNHYRNHEGQIDRSNGRVYRIRDRNAKPGVAPDLGKLTSAGVAQHVFAPNRWEYTTALRLLGDRKDRSLIPFFQEKLAAGQGPMPLRALWALHLCGGLDEPAMPSALQHRDPYVRLWAVRLACDRGAVSEAILRRLAELAEKEPHIDVRSQLACSARRLPVEQDLLLVEKLLTHGQDLNDPHIPLLLWWAIEAHCDKHPDRIVRFFEDKALWELPIVREIIIERLMRRFASTGQRRDLAICVRLLQLSPSAETTRKLLAGFEAAMAHRSLAGIPPELLAALAQYSRNSLAFGLRQGKPEAVKEALDVLRDPKADRSRRLQLAQILGDTPYPDAVPVLLDLATHSSDASLVSACLTSLQRYDDPGIGPPVFAAVPRMTDDVRSVALAVLSSRKGWARTLVEGVDAGRLDPALVPEEVVLRLNRYKDPDIAQAVRRHWSHLKPRSNEELQNEIERIAGVVRAGVGVPKLGRAIFNKSCARCHTLFAEGSNVGPDLTTYNRSDLDTLLLSIVHPNAEIREGFTNYVILTRDGRTISGLMTEQDPRMVVLRGGEGKDIAVLRTDVEEMEAAKTSLMPEGLLKGMSDQDLRDLIAYLRCTQPVIDR